MDTGSKNFWKIFQLAFLLSFTEQACCFSYFGSLNLSSTSNFLDTYIFAASSSPAFLIISCIGFSLGSFLTMVIFNYSLTQFIYFAIWLAKWPLNFFSPILKNIEKNRSPMSTFNALGIKHAFFSFFLIFVTFFLSTFLTKIVKDGIL